MKESETGDLGLSVESPGNPALADAPRKGVQRAAGVQPAPRVPVHPQSDAFISRWPAPGGPPAAARPGRPAPGPRTGIREGILFAAAALRLLASLAWEAVASAAHWTAYIFLSRHHRDEVRRLITRRPARERPVREPAGRLTGLLGAAGLIGWLAAGGLQGCKEIEQTRWSIETVLDASDSQKSLEQDLRSFGDDFSAREFFFSVDHLFGFSDVQKSKESLEWDLRALSDSDAGKHGVLETLRMLGW